MTIAVGRLEVDATRGCAVLDGREIPIRPLDLRLLAHLADHPDRVFTRESLVDALWGQDAHVDPRAVDTCVARLRRALDGAGDAIVTVRRVGYRLDTRFVGDTP